jgi:hypothetical protein
MTTVSSKSKEYILRLLSTQRLVLARFSLNSEKEIKDELKMIRKIEKELSDD